MSIIIIPNIFSAGAIIVASQHNSNFSTIYSDYNGNIDNTNLSPGAGISYSKLSLTGNVQNTDLAGSIADSKLLQITTASKVSGTAITGLASLPSGAGVIPAVNLPSQNINPISQTVVSTATTTGNISITNGNTYLVKFNFINISASDNVALRFNTDSGSHYSYAGNETNSTPTNTGLGSASDTRIKLNNSNLAGSSTTGIQGSFYIQQLGSSSTIYHIWGQTFYNINGGGIGNLVIGGQWFNSAAITSFAIFANGGNTMTGVVDLYQIVIG